MSKDLKSLVQRAQKGDVDAFASAFEDLRPVVLAVARGLVGPDDADDVVMETYLKAWQAIPRFNRRAALKTWLYRITYNCSLDFLRARARRKERFLSQAGDEDLPPPDVPDTTNPRPDEVAAAGDRAARVRHAVGLLPPDQRTTIQLRYTHDLSYAEIAAATGVSIGTVMSRLFNAKGKLRRLIEQEAT
jgi:RNA polymerase sigma-70 factor (ECF subfamily)